MKGGIEEGLVDVNVDVGTLQHLTYPRESSAIILRGVGVQDRRHNNTSL